MGSQHLVVGAEGDSFVVRNASGSKLTTPGTKASAVAAAVRYLKAQGGGTFSVRLPDGRMSAATRVEGGLGGDTGDTQERRAVAPAQPRPLQQTVPSVSSPDQPDKGGEWNRHLAKAAELVDEQLGLKDPQRGDVENKVRDLDMGTVLGPIGKHPMVRLINTHVSVGAAWILLISLWFGSGTVASIIKALTGASQGKATVGAYADVIWVFFTAFALCTSVAGVFVLARQGSMRGYAAVGWVSLGILAWCWALNSSGISAPNPQDLLAAMNRSSGGPIGKGLAMVPVFVVFYGPATFASGLGVGLVAGNLWYRIVHPETSANQ